MRKEEIMDSLQHLPDEMIYQALETRTKRKKTGLKAIAALAACLVIALVAGYLLTPPAENAITNLGGIDREYISQAYLEESAAIIWPWHYKTEAEKYPEVTLHSITYGTRGRSIGERYITELLGVGQGMGQDVYENKMHTKDFEVYAIRNVDPDKIVAVKMGDAYQVFMDRNYDPPAKLGDIVDAFNLAEHLQLNAYYDYRSGKSQGLYAIGNGDELLAMILSHRDAAYQHNDTLDRVNNNYIGFPITSEALGIYQQALYVTEDGYIWTNIFDYGYVFNIGPEEAARIITAAKAAGKPIDDNTTEHVEGYYSQNLIGTVAGVDEDYIYIDDSIRCKNPDDGLVFKASLDNLYILRCVDMLRIEEGELVMLTFTGSIDENLEVHGGTYVCHCQMVDDGVYITCE